MQVAGGEITNHAAKPDAPELREARVRRAGFGGVLIELMAAATISVGAQRTVVIQQPAEQNEPPEKAQKEKTESPAAPTKVAAAKQKPGQHLSDGLSDVALAKSEASAKSERPGTPAEHIPATESSTDVMAESTDQVDSSPAVPGGAEANQSSGRASPTKLQRSREAGVRTGGFDAAPDSGQPTDQGDSAPSLAVRQAHDRLLRAPNDTRDSGQSTDQPDSNSAVRGGAEANLYPDRASTTKLQQSREAGVRTGGLDAAPDSEQSMDQGDSAPSLALRAPNDTRELPPDGADPAPASGFQTTPVIAPAADAGNARARTVAPSAAPPEVVRPPQVTRPEQSRESSADLQHRERIAPARRAAAMARTRPPLEFIRRIARQIALRRAGSASDVRLALTPPNLGAVRLRIRVSQGEVSGEIVAESHATRHLLQQHLPDLREILLEEGLSLGEFHVRSDGRQDDGEGKRKNFANAAPESATRVAAQETEIETASVRDGRISGYM